MSGRQGPLLEVMNEGLAQAEDSASPPHPSPISEVRIFSSPPQFGMDEPHTLCWEDTQKDVCVWRGGLGKQKGRDRDCGSLGGDIRGGTFLAGMNPFILKSNPHCRKGRQA